MEPIYPDSSISDTRILMLYPICSGGFDVLYTNPPRYLYHSHHIAARPYQHHVGFCLDCCCCLCNRVLLCSHPPYIGNAYHLCSFVRCCHKAFSVGPLSTDEIVDCFVSLSLLIYKLHIYPHRECLSCVWLFRGVLDLFRVSYFSVYVCLSGYVI
jgi:hypothetical protein